MGGKRPDFLVSMLPNINRAMSRNMLPDTAKICFNEKANLVIYKGYSIPAESCADWLQKAVRTRLNDVELEEELFDHILELEGFNSSDLLAALTTPEVQNDDADIGETIAELALIHDTAALFPYPRKRDLRGRRANLQGCDLVGFIKRQDGRHQFVFAEVKTSTQETTPPTVLSGVGGLQNQLADLILDGLILKRLLTYVYSRLKNTSEIHKFTEAVQLLSEGFNNNKKIVGVLVRDTEPNSKDVSGYALKLSTDFPKHEDLSYLVVYMGLKQCEWNTHCAP